MTGREICQLWLFVPCHILLVHVDEEHAADVVVGHVRISAIFWQCTHTWTDQCFYVHNPTWVTPCKKAYQTSQWQFHNEWWVCWWDIVHFVFPHIWHQNHPPPGQRWLVTKHVTITQRWIGIGKSPHGQMLFKEFNLACGRPYIPFHTSMLTHPSWSTNWCKLNFLIISSGMICVSCAYILGNPRACSNRNF